MKILILSCSTGGGHNSAAQAVRDLLHMRGVETEMFDPIQLKSKKAKNIVSDLYNNIIKNTPKLFGAIYKVGAIYEATPFPSPVYYANSVYAKELNDYIVENKFDGVICSHLYCMEAMTAIRKKLNPDIPCYGIITDYTLIPFTSDTKLDGYFIPHEELRKEAIKKGLPKDGIYAYGIPVNQKFNERIPKIQAREALGLPKDKKILLLMFGSVGCGKIIKVCNNIVKDLNEDCVAYVIVGNNEKLKETLDKKFEGKRIRTVAYTEDVNVYMNAADVLISKAGGLSSTEAAVANIPLVHLKSIPGCETKNARFFASKGMSLATKKPKAAVSFAKELIYDEARAQRMCAAQKKIINANATRDIVDTIMQKIARE